MPTNKNETVDKACLILYAHPEAEAFDGSGFTVLNNKEIADCILAAHKRELAEKDAEIKRLTNIINAECNKCADCAKFGVDCSAGDVDGNEDCRACEKFISKEVAAKDAEIKQLREALKPITNLMLNDNCSRNCVGNGMCNQCDFYDSCDGEDVFSAVREAKEKAREVLNG